MRPAELSPNCELCGQPADYCDSVPDAGSDGNHPSEAGYRLTPLCWIHAVERRGVSTSRIREILRCESQGIARLDRGRASGVGLVRLPGLRTLLLPPPA